MNVCTVEEAESTKLNVKDESEIEILQRFSE